MAYKRTYYPLGAHFSSHMLTFLLYGPSKDHSTQWLFNLSVLICSNITLKYANSYSSTLHST